MANSKPKAPTYRTPRGTFKFPRLGEPDTKFNAAGEYSVKLVLGAEAAAAFIAKFAETHATAIKDGKKAYAELPVATRKKLDAKGGFTANPLGTPVYNDAEEETGEFEFNFKMTASGEVKNGPRAGQKWTRKPAVFDSQGKPMDGKKVWGGSVGIIAFVLGVSKDTGRPGYFIPGTGAAGLKFGLDAAQIITLVQGGNKDAKGYGFENEEGGYTDEGSALPEETPTGETEQTGTGDGSSDF